MKHFHLSPSRRPHPGIDQKKIDDAVDHAGQFLLAKQDKDGHWNHPEWVEDTCYAVLFLRRATKPLSKVYSER